MKLKIAIFAAVSLLSTVAFATYTRQNAKVVTSVITPVYVSGSVTSVPVSSDVVQLLVNDSDSTDVRGQSDMKNVSFDLLDPLLTSTTITAAGKTVTYPQLAALLRQAVLDRANAAGIQ